MSILSTTQYTRLTITLFGVDYLSIKNVKKVILLHLTQKGRLQTVWLNIVPAYEIKYYQI